MQIKKCINFPLLGAVLLMQLLRPYEKKLKRTALGLLGVSGLCLLVGLFVIALSFFFVLAHMSAFIWPALATGLVLGLGAVVIAIEAWRLFS